MKLFAAGWSDGYDGPGRRRIVYLQGCNFACRWCANPEGMGVEAETLFRPDRAPCAAAACPHGAVAETDDGPRLDRRVCADCPDEACVTVWKHPAFQRSARELSVDDLVDEAVDCRALFGPDGGVTFGGGEATLQADAVLDAADRLESAGVDVAVETNAGTEAFARFVGRDMLLVCDCKCVDADRHRAWTGADNARVLDNLRRAASGHERLLVRVTLVPGFNTDADEMERIAAFLGECASLRDTLRVEAARMHRMGAPKYAALDRSDPMEGVDPPPKEAAETLVRLLRERNVDAVTI